ITDTVTPSKTFTTSWPINIPQTVGSNTAFVGFSGGTGAATALQQILTWTYSINNAPNFSLTATPASLAVAEGSSASFTANVVGGPGFKSAVSFSVAGLPNDATASFNPTGVTSSGTSTMTVSTASTTPAGTYILQLTGTSGSLAHTVPVTLVVVEPGSATPV